MRAGNLRNRVDIQYKIETQDQYGSPVYNWKRLATVWAAVEPVSEREYLAASASHQERLTRFVMRSREDVNSEMRISWRKRLYDIESVIRTEERQRDMILMCTESV